MQKQYIFYIIITTIFLLSIIFTACNLVTDKPSEAQPPIGDDLVLNEFYTISPEKYYSYSWIEIYNPSRENRKWNEFFIDTTRENPLQLRTTYLVLPYQRQFFELQFPDYILHTDTVNGVILLWIADSVIFPNQYFVITNHREAFYAHFRLGPFNPILVEIATVSDFIENLGYLSAYWKPIPEGTIYLMRTTFDLTLVPPYGYRLINPRDTVIDVMSYANVPEGKSIARYGGYYYRNDPSAFYISPDPIPGWHSQRVKK